MEAAVTEEIIARQPPQAQAIIRLLRATIAEMKARAAQAHGRIADLETENARHRTRITQLRAADRGVGGAGRAVADADRQVDGGKRGTQDADRPVEGGERGTEDAARGIGAAGEGQDAAELLGAAGARDIRTTGRRPANANPTGNGAGSPATRSTRDRRFPPASATTLTTFLGEPFYGIVNCDRAKMYWQLGRLQWCWAHLKRDFQGMIDRGTVQGKWLGRRLRRLTCEFFEHWAGYGAGKILWVTLRRRMGLVRRKVERLLLRGTESRDAEVRGTCRKLYEHRQWLWTFLRHQGVEPTRPTFGWCPAGERSLRHAVIWRKLSFPDAAAPLAAGLLRPC